LIPERYTSSSSRRSQQRGEEKILKKAYCYGALTPPTHREIEPAASWFCGFEVEGSLQSVVVDQILSWVEFEGLFLLSAEQTLGMSRRKGGEEKIGSNFFRTEADVPRASSEFHVYF